MIRHYGLEFERHSDHFDDLGLLDRPLVPLESRTRVLAEFQNER